MMGSIGRAVIDPPRIRRLHPDRFEPCSAGTKPGQLDSRAVRVMTEAGIDISKQRSKSLEAVAGVVLDYVITVLRRYSGDRLTVNSAGLHPTDIHPFTRLVKRRVLEWLDDPESAGHWVAPRQRLSTEGEEGS